jgi:hypothetical protein
MLSLSEPDLLKGTSVRRTATGNCRKQQCLPFAKENRDPHLFKQRGVFSKRGRGPSHVSREPEIT